MKRALICCLLLAGCAGLADTPEVAAPLVPPTSQVVAAGLSKAADEAKLTGALEASAVRPGGPLSPGAPGVFLACVRSPQPDRVQAPYAVFFKTNAYASSRLALAPDGCYAEAYQPFTRVVVPK